MRRLPPAAAFPLASSPFVAAFAYGPTWPVRAATAVLAIADPLVWSAALSFRGRALGSRARRVLPAAQVLAFAMFSFTAIRFGWLGGAGAYAPAIALLAMSCGMGEGRLPDVRPSAVAACTLAAGGDAAFGGLVLAVSVVAPILSFLAASEAGLASVAPVMRRMEALDRQVEALSSERRGAYTDHLTGLLNRRGFDMAATAVLNHSLLDGTGFGAMLLDIDFFKSINDRFGHDMGDEALRSLAATLSSAVRPGTDVVARWGGEEFVVLAEGVASEDHLLVLAERVRGLVEASRWGTGPDGEPLGFTVSVGCSMGDARSGGVSAAISRADAALYRAKGSGRNRVEPESGEPRGQ